MERRYRRRLDCAAVVATARFSLAQSRTAPARQHRVPRRWSAIRRGERGDRRLVPWRESVACLKTPPQLVDRDIKKVQLDPDTQATTSVAQFVAFDSRPQPEIEDDAEAEAQSFFGQGPELPLEPLAEFSIPWS